MDFPYHLLFPLIGSMLYVAGVMFIKQTADRGVGVWRATFVANLLTLVMFAPLWFFGGSSQPASMFWQPALVGLLFMSGQGLSFLALEKGDVSVATPVLGIKIIMVAGLTTVLLAESVPLTLWIAAGLSTAAVALLNRSKGSRHRNVGFTIIVSILAAASFALFDVLIQKWSPAWGTGRFLPIMMAFVAVYSFALIPKFSAPLRAIPRNAWKSLWLGSFFIGLQALVIISTLAVYGDATAVNVVYATRGLWSVLAVWLVGHWFQNKEQTLGKDTLRERLFGAFLLMLAIVLVLL